MFNYSLIIDERDFYLACNKELLNLVSNAISLIIRKTRNTYIEIVKSCLRNDPDQTYDALCGGLLRADLGLEDGCTEAEEVVNYIAKSIELRKLTGTSTTLGGIKVVILRSGIEPLLEMPFASYVSNGHEIPWLKWLLTSGSEIVVANYSVIYGSDFPTSRTGQAIMGKKKTGGGGFRIRGEHAGTENVNWITKALLLCAEEKITSEMQAALSEFT